MSNALPRTDSEASWPGEVVLALQKRLSYAEGTGNVDVDVPWLEDRPAGLEPSPAQAGCSWGQVIHVSPEPAVFVP